MNVLITSAGRRGQLVQAFNLRVAEYGISTRVMGADASPLAAAPYLADEQLIVPRIDSNLYLSTILDLCSLQGVKLLIPTIDTELKLLSGAQSLFNSVGTTVCVSAPAVIQITSSKALTHQWLVAQGFPAPRQLNERESLGSLGEQSVGVVLKPVSGSRSIGVSFHSLSELPAVVPEGFVCQECILGEEFTVSTYVNRHGKCVAAVPRLRLEVRDGEVSKGRTVADPAMEKLVRDVAESLPGAWGPLNIQIIKERETDRLFIIEINARFGGGDPLAWVAGCDIPSYLLSEVVGSPFSGSLEWRSGVTMLRFDQAVYLDSAGEQIYVG
jgi:carbamoyl-phosphate synthase large subunit